MLIPVGSDRDPRNLPAATLSIILLTALLYAAVTMGLRSGAAWAEGAIMWGAFTPTRAGFRWWQPITYQFLHDPSSIVHVGFNLLFLWVFGRSVEGRLGPWWFACFYVAGGAFAALGQALVSPNPTIGASGAVAGATGAYAALFPRSRVKVLLVFFLIGMYELPGLAVVGIYVGLDALNQALNFLGRSREPVAYAAHLAGYAWGLGIALALLATRTLPRTEMDLFAIWTQARRRRAMRSAVGGSASGPWAGASADTADRLARARADAAAARGAAGSTQETAHDPARHEAAQRLAAMVSAHDAAGASAAWHALAAIDARMPLGERMMMDAAALMHTHGDMRGASDAWLRALERFPRGAQACETALLASAVLARRLGQPERARRLLADWMPRLCATELAPQARALAQDLGVAEPSGTPPAAR